MENINWQQSYFKKKMNKYLFIPPFSNHALHVHKGWVTSHIKIIRLNCTNNIDFLLHKNTFFLRLLVRGYDSQVLIPTFKQKIHRKLLIKNLIQKQHTTTNIDKSSPVMIFKLPTCSRTCQLKTKLKNVSDLQKLSKIFVINLKLLETLKTHRYYAIKEENKSEGS